MYLTDFVEVNQGNTDHGDVFQSLGLYSVQDLTDEDRKPPEFIIDGMIPVGMTFLSGAPKTRKSFLALQMAVAVGSGKPFMGFPVTKCDVAYFDLEGSKRRISSRTDCIREPVPPNVYFTHKNKEKLSDGLVDVLRNLHRENPEIRFIIIDTFSRARGKYTSGGMNAYDADVMLLEPIQRLALEENIAILFVHHDKKGAAYVSDSFERLSGTMGISGSADCVLNLITEGTRFSGHAKLEYTPRDAIGGELSLSFDPLYTEWSTEERTNLLNNPVCSWIVRNAPAKGLEGQFYSYDDIFSSANGISCNNPGYRIQELVKPHLEAIYHTYRIGIQIGCKSNGKRGLRIVNLQ